MSDYQDRRREEARRRLAARQSGRSDSLDYSDDYDRYGVARGRSAAPSLRSLHQVSPEMRERYSASGRQASRTRSAERYDAWDDYDDVTWDDGRGSDYGDWAGPSVDPIGSHSMNGRGEPARAGLPRALGNLGVAFWVVLGIVVVLLAAVIVLATNSCSAGDVQAGDQLAASEQGQDGDAAAPEGSGAEGASEGSGSAEASSGSSTMYGIDRSKLEALLDDETVERLLTRAETSDEAKWIAQHPEAYAGDGGAVQVKLLKLAANEPAAFSYVRSYPDKYPMAKPAAGKINTVATGGRNIPRFYQWDAIWGYTTYSGAAFGLTGCAPTALAMVYQGLTGDNSLSPYDMAEMAEEDGYMTDEEGTIGSFFVDEAHALGLSVQSIDVTEDALKEALQSQQVVVANFGPGDFTEHGHYVVLTGATQDGMIIMNDPYSEERSNKTWDYGIIVDNAIAFYAYG